MQLIFDQYAPKRATNLSLNSDLLKQAKDIGINISQFVERALGDQVKRYKEAQWLRENESAYLAIAGADRSSEVVLCNTMSTATKMRPLKNSTPTSWKFKADCYKA
jgi:antitoxin CcdA